MERGARLGGAAVPRNDSRTTRRRERLQRQVGRRPAETLSRPPVSATPSQLAAAALNRPCPELQE